MYIKTKSYDSVEEYVRDLTGCTYREKDKDNRALAYIWYIVGVLVIMRLMMDSAGTDASFATVIVILAFTVFMIVGLPRIYRMLTNDSAEKESYAIFLDVMTVIDCIPSKNEWKDIDQAFADLMMNRKASASDIANTREKRKACAFASYVKKPENILEYAKYVGKCQSKNGYFESLKEFANALEEQLREEERRRKKAEDEKRRKTATLNAKFIWKRLKDVYSTRDVKNEKSLGQRRYIMLENEYKKAVGIEKETVVFDVENKITDERLLDYIDCFYLIKATKGDRGKIKELLEPIILNSNFKLSYNERSNNKSAVIRKLTNILKTENKPVKENEEQEISDEAVIELLAYMISKGCLFGNSRINQRLDAKRENRYVNEVKGYNRYTYVPSYTTYETEESNLDDFLEIASVTDPEDIELLADEYGINLDDVPEYYDRSSDSSYDYIETSFVDGCDELYDAYGEVKY